MNPATQKSTHTHRTRTVSCNLGWGGMKEPNTMRVGKNAKMQFLITYQYLQSLLLMDLLFFKLILERERKGQKERERETWISCSIYFCIHWLILVYPLARDLTSNLGVSERHFNPAVPNLFGSRDQCCGQFFHGPGGVGIVSGWFKWITFKLSSCCASWSLTVPDQYQSVAQRLGMPALNNWAQGLSFFVLLTYFILSTKEH